MGIKENLKNMLSDDKSTSNDMNNLTKDKTTNDVHPRGLRNTTTISNKPPNSLKLPHGTGPGTSGKAIGGNENTDVFNGSSSGIPKAHSAGHPASDLHRMASDNISSKSHQLNPVTHEKVRHVEVEELVRQKEHDRHIHHVQHHTQPVVASEVSPEQHHKKVHPVMHIQEKHANTVEDNTKFNDQVRKHKNTVEHGEAEHTVVDKGTVVNENVHHHVHHVIQPVIQKETIDNHRVHTVIPIHQVTHEMPIIQEPRTMAPVSIDQFLGKGGLMSGGFSHDQIGKKVLHGGDCSRDVDNLGENLAHELKLGKSNKGSVEDKVQSSNIV